MHDSLFEEIEKSILAKGTGALGVAVSGGSDSLALLHLLSTLSKTHNLELHAITVDHGLREASADEARFVAGICARLNIPHHIVKWQGWDGRGNTQNEARRARYSLIADWAHGNRINSVALGHTKDDQAETFLMRLARGSGVDGLSAMAPCRKHLGLLWLRPLLNVSRKALRSYLEATGQKWIDDPSNEDTRFERIKARERLTLLEELGIDTDTLAQVAKNMSHARDALNETTLSAARKLVTLKAGAVCLKWEALCSLPVEIRRRLLVASLNWVSGSEYPPRREALSAAWSSVYNKGTATLGGCLLKRNKENLWVCRELKAIHSETAASAALWDGRWRITSTDETVVYCVKPLGAQGLQAFHDWRETGLPREVLLCTPAVWQGEDLVSAPVVKPDPEWQATLERGDTHFFDAVISH